MKRSHLIKTIGLIALMISNHSDASGIFKHLLETGKDAIKKKLVVANTFTSRVAAVRVSNDICPDEKQFIAQRMPHVKNALEQFLGYSLDGKYIPRIALVASGGGYRAMTCTIGSLIGAQDIGIFDAVTYLAALSGSTWAVNLLLTAGHKNIGAFKQALAPDMGQSIFKQFRPDKAMITMLLIKSAFNQPITLVDLYGAALADHLLRTYGNERFTLYLSDQADTIKSGEWPLPLYCAITTTKDASQNYIWVEYTPFEIGSATWGMYIPTWAWGRRFYKGISQDFAPEQPLSFNMGTFGSVFGATVQQIYENDLPPLVKRYLDAIDFDARLKPIQGYRFSFAKVNNFTFGMTGNPVLGPYMELVDAGLDFNLPYPLVSGQHIGRQADILIFLDASEIVDGAPALQRAEQYARSHGLKFPSIDYTDIGSHIISVFKDETDPQAPVVIYMPRIMDNALWAEYKDKVAYQGFVPYLDTFDIQDCITHSFCKTINFAYTVQDVDQLCALTEFNMKVSRDTIKKTIEWVIAKHA